MSIVNLNISQIGFDAVIAEIGATDKQVRAALKTTVRKMARWVKTRSARTLAADLAVPQKIVKRRLKIKNATGTTATVWYGFDNVGLIYLSAKQTKAGVKASGGRFVESGFIPKSKKNAVFKRVGKERLPIKKQSAPIKEPGDAHVESLADAADFEAQFFKIFEHELKWRASR